MAVDPFDAKQKKIGEVSIAVANLMRVLGLYQRDEHLKETPTRVAKFWVEFLDYEPGKIETSFTHSTQIDQVVALSGIRVWSVCAHHLLPFYCDLSIAYIPKGKILGLSKLARIAKKFAHKPQVQESLVKEIADYVQLLSDSEDVAVYGQGLHLCMAMRGVEMEGLMSTSDLRGAFREESSARAEFFSIVRLASKSSGGL